MLWGVNDHFQSLGTNYSVLVVSRFINITTTNANTLSDSSSVKEVIGPQLTSP